MKTKTEIEKRNADLCSIFLDKKLTLAECGRIFGITRERVRKILNANGIKARRLRGLGLQNQKQRAIFWSRVKITANPKECWEWQGGLHSAGYGIFPAKGFSTHKAHIISFMLSNGQNPKNLVCHKCDNPPCVNPNHLYDGTHADNYRDRVLRHRGITDRY